MNRNLLYRGLFILLLAGAAFGERVGHYIEHRDRYHL